MLAAQSGLRGTLNSVWAEKARIAAKESVKEQHKRARACLFGRLKHISSTGDTPLADGTRRLLNLPEEWSRSLADTDVASLQTLADGLDFAGTMQLLAKLRDGHPVTMPKLHVDALRAMLASVEERFGCPDWIEENVSVQLHLDFRCLPGGRVALDALLDGMNAALPQVIQTGAPVQATFLVAGIVARGTPLKVDAVLHKSVLQRLVTPAAGTPRLTSLLLEIGPRECVVKAVLSLEPKVISLSEATHLVGRDFGYTNTVALTVVAVDLPIDEKLIAASAAWTKAQAKAYLESHWHDGAPVEQVLLDGKDFLGRIKEQALAVDRKRSEIDLVLNRVRRIKHEVNRLLGQPPGTWVDLESGPASNDQRLLRLLAKLPKLLAQLGRLKALRRAIYRSVEGLKTSWFGWVSTVEAKLARKYDAAVVREDLTVVAKEKERPDYKGRTFNKMMNNGAKGHYLRRARAKLKWRGIPEVVVPSAWSSSTDVRNGVVDKKQRKGSLFRASVDGREMQADLHASLTLALWPLLRPKAAMATASTL